MHYDDLLTLVFERPFLCNIDKASLSLKFKKIEDENPELLRAGEARHTNLHNGVVMVEERSFGYDAIDWENGMPSLTRDMEAEGDDLTLVPETHSLTMADMATIIHNGGDLALKDPDDVIYIHQKIEQLLSTIEIKSQDPFFQTPPKEHLVTLEFFQTRILNLTKLRMEVVGSKRTGRGLFGNQRTASFSRTPSGNKT